MQRRQCQCDPRDVVTACADVARAADDYAAGYADGLADVGD
jgi:hypothetical protein